MGTSSKIASKSAWKKPVVKKYKVRDITRQGGSNNSDSTSTGSMS